MEEYKCCNNPDYSRAWAMYLFKCKYCNNCHETMLDDNPVMEWLFEHIFSMFWTGMVSIEYEMLSK